MSIQGMHPEEIKCKIRIAFGSAQAFERRYGLVHNAVSDLLRGRSSARTAKALESFLAGNPPPEPGVSQTA